MRRNPLFQAPPVAPAPVINLPPPPLPPPPPEEDAVVIPMEQDAVAEPDIAVVVEIEPPVAVVVVPEPMIVEHNDGTFSMSPDYEIPINDRVPHVSLISLDEFVVENNQTISQILNMIMEVQPLQQQDENEEQQQPDQGNDPALPDYARMFYNSGKIIKSILTPELRTSAVAIFERASVVSDEFSDWVIENGDDMLLLTRRRNICIATALVIGKMAEHLGFSFFAEMFRGKVLTDMNLKERTLMQEPKPRCEYYNHFSRRGILNKTPQQLVVEMIEYSTAVLEYERMRLIIKLLRAISSNDPLTVNVIMLTPRMSDYAWNPVVFTDHENQVYANDLLNIQPHVNGETPLMYACRNGFTSAVYVLLRHWDRRRDIHQTMVEDVTIRENVVSDNVHVTAFYLAVINQRLGAVILILLHAATREDYLTDDDMAAFYLAYEAESGKKIFSEFVADLSMRIQYGTPYTIFDKSVYYYRNAGHPEQDIKKSGVVFTMLYAAGSLPASLYEKMKEAYRLATINTIEDREDKIRLALDFFLPGSGGYCFPVPDEKIASMFLHYLLRRENDRVFKFPTAIFRKVIDYYIEHRETISMAMSLHNPTRGSVDYCLLPREDTVFDDTYTAILTPMVTMCRSYAQCVIDSKIHDHTQEVKDRNVRNANIYMKMIIDICTHMPISFPTPITRKYIAKQHDADAYALLNMENDAHGFFDFISNRMHPLLWRILRDCACVDTNVMDLFFEMSLDPKKSGENYNDEYRTTNFEDMVSRSGPVMNERLLSIATEYNQMHR